MTKPSETTSALAAGPEWLVLTDMLGDPTLRAAEALICGRRQNPDEGHRGRLALLHFASCFEMIGHANLKGFHSVSIALHRQCVEAISVIEAAVLADDERATQLLSLWLKNGKAGELRKVLGEQVWPSYGAGLDGEPWVEFFGQLAKAVQEYSHCSPLLLGWQVHFSRAVRCPDGGILGISREGGYDAQKASLVTLLQAVLTWALARIVLENGGAIDGFCVEDVRKLGDGIVRSPLFARGKLWAVQFWPHLIEPESSSMF